jgi:hypothetical protein
MKRLTTIVFAALVALTLSVPVWAQAPAANSQKTESKQTNEKKGKAKKAEKAKKETKKSSKKETK